MWRCMTAAALAFSLFVGIASAGTISFTIENRSDFDIVEVFAVPSHIREAPTTPLRASAVAAGASAKLSVQHDFCAFEIYLSFSDGRWYHGSADFCDADIFVFDPVPAGWVEVE